MGVASMTGSCTGSNVTGVVSKATLVRIIGGTLILIAVYITTRWGNKVKKKTPSNMNDVMCPVCKAENKRLGQ
jgi:uncharacterized membrane protein YfcA